MLVLSRGVGEQVVLPECEVTIEVLQVGGRKVRIGVNAPPEIAVHRKETWHRIRESVSRRIETCANAAAGLRVLIAEPDKNLAASYAAYLSRRGFDVHTVSDGVACLARLRRRPFDVVVLDPAVLWGGGAGVVALLRDDPSLPLVPVLIHGGDDDTGGISETSFPVVDCAAKPIEPQRLEERIREVVGNFRQQTKRMLLNRVSPELAGRLARAIDARVGGRFRYLAIRDIDGQLYVQGHASSYHARQLVQAAVTEALGDSELIPLGEIVFDIEVTAVPR